MMKAAQELKLGKEKQVYYVFWNTVGILIQ